MIAGLMARTTKAPSSDPLRLELSRMAALVRLMWWTEVGAQRFTKPPRSGDEVDAELVRLEALAERPATAYVQQGDPQLDELAERLREREVACRTARSASASHPLYKLAARAQLEPLALDLFLLALAPEIDDGFGRVAIFLRGGGATRRAIDVATAGRVLAPDGTGADAVRRALAPSSPLDRLGLITLGGFDGVGVTRLTLGSLLVVPPPVVAAVLGLHPEDAALRAFVRVGEKPPSRAEVSLPDEVWKRLEGLLADPNALPLIEGPAGVGRREAVRVLCGERKQELVEVDVEHAAEGLSSEEALAVARLAWLRDAALCVRLPPLDPSNAGKEPPWRRGVLALVARHPGKLAIVREPGPALPLELAHGRRLTLVQLSLPEPDVREKLWRKGLGEVRGVETAMLAHNYPLTPAAIARAAEEAKLIATARGEKLPELRDVIDAVDVQFAPRLQTVGRRLRTRARLDEMVLQEETRETLLEMEATIRLRHRVLDEWKLGRLVRGRGVSALFYGEPGTGKTMSAGAIAEAAGLPLYQIDTAQVVSKWIGETEKNLGEVFRAAEAAHAMLLFDEADAVFGKRTDVEHSTDRYANMQTNFLLTQIELFNGISILTTNRESVMDPAFQRRLSFRVYFPMPEVAEREDLWKRMLAGQTAAPLEKVDTKHLAQRLVMSGGYIRNAVLRAAYLAAAAGKPLTTETLRHAAELVLRDAGKVI
jgi:AAA+ superfamily predicted ATPase